ncbi:hypothetical protein SLEP1_g14097 [Rubroshorea leprosula]|uniref:Uncharacterized protein n=1 Tax=Rubroshorea leprosula TaxID=152421 RepID=A0AAV5ISK7_9ROSI|nr:hypothetical protein SLEP1_g14097 [Rubroshorea leprosula]
MVCFSSVYRSRSQSSHEEKVGGAVHILENHVEICKRAERGMAHHPSVPY